MNCPNPDTTHCPAKNFSGKQISEAGIYRIDAFSEKDIVVSSGVSAHIFDATSGVGDFSRRITLEKSSDIVICGYVYDAGYNLEIITAGEGVSINVAYLLASTAGTQVTTKISTKILHSHTNSTIHIVSFVGESGDISVDGEMNVIKGVMGAKAHLREDNIFLGDTGKIQSIPTLRIHTDDVVAGHSARVERIPEEKLYYLLSRGLDKKSATTLLLESMVGSLFYRLKNISEALYEDLKLDILTSVSRRNEQ